MATYNQVPTKHPKTNPTETAESLPSDAPQYPGVPPVSVPPSGTEPNAARSYRWCWSLFAGLLFLSMALTFADVVVWVEGVPQLHPRRLGKLDKELREIDHAEQYVLLAKIAGWYECLTCPGKLIYLLPGQVWKYGVTRKGEQKRHGLVKLENKALLYQVQFVGNYAQCLAQEKIKIYSYPLLPENLSRPDSLRLAYPPGNMQDN